MQFGRWAALLLFGVAQPILVLQHLMPLVTAALYTGVLPANGRTYSRVTEPGRYWAGIVFWIAAIALSALATWVIWADTMRR